MALSRQKYIVFIWSETDLGADGSPFQGVISKKYTGRLNISKAYLFKSLIVSLWRWISSDLHLSYTWTCQYNLEYRQWNLLFFQGTLTMVLFFAAIMLPISLVRIYNVTHTRRRARDLAFARLSFDVTTSGRAQLFELVPQLTPQFISKYLP